MLQAKILPNNKLIVNENVVSDSIKFEKVRFYFTDEWTDYEKTAVFSNGDAVYNIVLNSNNPLCTSQDECFIPFEVIKTPCFSISVFGIKGDSRITATGAEVVVLESGYKLGEEPSVPTPDEYSQIIEIMSATNEIALSVREDADKGLFKGDKGDTGPQGEQGIRGEKGEKGDVGPKGDRGPIGETGPQGIKGDKGDAGVDGKDAITDQVFSPTSPNAQSGKAVAEAVAQISPDFESALYEQASISFVQGSIYSANYSEIANSKQVRSDYIPFDSFVRVSGDENFLMYIYLFNISREGFGKIGWTSSIDAQTILNDFPDTKYIRVIVKNVSDTDIVPSDVNGHISLTVDKHIKENDYSVLPVISLTGDISAMSKDDAVKLNYKLTGFKNLSQNLEGTCTCKWQGMSSVNRGYPKRNYTIKFGSEIDVGYGLQKKYCLKANWIDPSAARNIVNAKLWSQVVESRSVIHEKLVAAPNYGAVDGFPVLVRINDEFSGLYTFNIPKDGWMFAMGEGNSEYIVSSESNSRDSSKFKKDPTFSVDQNSVYDTTTDFEIEYKPDGVTDETVINSFKQVVNSVMAVNSTNGSTWESDVGQYINIDSAIDYYIFACCLGAYDNLSKNILYVTYDGIKWYLSAYDLSSTYGAHVYGEEWYKVVNDRTQFKEATTHKLFECIYTYSKDKLKARYKELRSSVLSNENIWFMLNNFITKIPRNIYNLDAERWTTMPATAVANANTYIDYYKMHCAYLDKEIDALEDGARTKNLIPFPYADTSKEQGGVIYTVNADGSITIKGTATANSTFKFANSGDTLGLKSGDEVTFSLGTLWDYGMHQFVYNKKNGAGQEAIKVVQSVESYSFTVPEDYESVYMFQVTVGIGSTVNTTIYPQLEYGSVATDYEPV